MIQSLLQYTFLHCPFWNRYIQYIFFGRFGTVELDTNIQIGCDV